MRVLVIQHVPFEHLGRISSVLATREVGVTRLELYRDSQTAYDLDSHAGLILMGGPMSANDNLDYIRKELLLIEEALALGKPVLGICLGSQLIARATGARVYRNQVKEIGWAPVYRTEAARQDWLLSGLSRSELVFHWHGETFDLPHDAEWLVWSDACRHQAFRLGSAYGIQFHLEVTPEMIADWVTQEANQSDVAGLTGPIDPGVNAARLAEISAAVFGRWCDLLAQGTGGRPGQGST